MNEVNSPGADPIWTLRAFDRARQKALCGLFSDLPLQDPAQHFLILCLLRAHDKGVSPSQRDLGRMIERSPATVTASLRVLERQGLVARTPDDQDLRVNRVDLTDRGLALARECQRRIGVLEDAMFRAFSPEEQTQLHAILGKMIRNLAALSGQEEGGMDL